MEEYEDKIKYKYHLSFQPLWKIMTNFYITRYSIILNTFVDFPLNIHVIVSLYG